MALTQISTAGVKDDAVTSGKIPADAIGSSEIAANAVGSSELADNAVDTAAIADDAVTGAKIATDAVTSDSINGSAVGTSHLSDNAVATAKIASEAVTSAKIADQAVTLAKLPHGTSSNDGKFLRANNGADPTFETVSGTTINNNGSNRIITGSGTANTLEGESTFTYDGTNVAKIDTDQTYAQMQLDGSSGGAIEFFENGNRKFEIYGIDAGVEIYDRDKSAYHSKFLSGGNFEVSDGDIKIATSGHGIDFSATANAALFAPATPTQTGQGYDPSTDSEVLTHYEHGTWTPRLRAYDHTNSAGWGHMVYSDGTVVEGTGRYIRIGRLVWAGFNIDSGSKQFDTGWTYWSIDTIPFGANHYDGRSGGVQVFRTNAFTDTTNIIGGRVNGADAYLVGTRPSGEYNATLNTSSTGRFIQGHLIIYTSTG